MKKRTATTTISSDIDTSRRHKTLRKTEARSDTAPQWLHEAAANFVASTPSLKWTGSFYSWGTWLDDLRSISAWTVTSHSKPAWRTLIDSCKASAQVRGTAALYRVKSDLVSIIVDSVFRIGEEQRVMNSGETAAAERDVMRRVRAVVTRQRRHEAVALTFIRYLDLAFVLSAYKECRLDRAADERESPLEAGRQVEEELMFFELKPRASEIRAATRRMEQYMWDNRWLPWYEQVPGVRDEMVIQAREAALEFCKNLPFAHVHVRPGVRGLSRDHLAGAGSMDEWLVTLLEPSLRNRWATLAEVYEVAVRDERGEEDALMEETSRRVLQTVLEPLIEYRDGMEASDSKLVDAAPGIVVTQSVRIAGRFTFRQLLELYIHLTMFGEYLQTSLNQHGLPSVEEIHTGVVLYEEIRRRALEVRSVIDSKNVDTFVSWCLATQEQYAQMPSVESQLSYQQTAVKAALGSAIVRYAANPNALFPDIDIAQSDPLTYAATVAEWDPSLAAKIIDAAVRIGNDMRLRFKRGSNGGLDLYSYRRVVVCDAARERFRGDKLAAARMMRRLHPVWEVCEQDKEVGVIDAKGIMSLHMAAENDNFEACALYGVILCSLEWAEKRQQICIQTSIAAGIEYICKAISMGDAGGAVDLVHLLKCNSSQQRDHAWNIPHELVLRSVQRLKYAAQDEPCLQLFVGYLYSVGAAYVPVDCKAAARAYQIVLDSSLSCSSYQAYAANNLGVLQILNAPEVNRTASNNARAINYVKAAASVLETKAGSNLGALLCLESRNSKEILESAKQTYRRHLESKGCSSPVAVLQTSSEAKEVTVFEMSISPQHQESFCRDLRSEGMPLERYGEILNRETLPYTPIGPSTDSLG